MDWLTHLSETLKAEAVQEKPEGWALITELAESLRLSRPGAMEFAKRKVQSGEWQAMKMKIYTGGKARLVNLYRPARSSATVARRSS